MTQSTSAPVVLVEHDAAGDICTFHTDLFAAVHAAKHLRVRRHSTGLDPVAVSIRPAVTDCLGATVEPTER